MFGRLAFIGIVGLALTVVVSQSGGKAAQANIAQSCPGGPNGGVTVSFVWPAAGEGALETYLDLGLNSAFTPASFQSYGPFEPGQTAYALAALPQDLDYHYRVQARTATEWKLIAKGSFTSECSKPAAPISAAMRCIEGPEPGQADDGVAVTFTWTPGAGGEQWIDISPDGDSFAPGSYTGYGPALAGASTHEVSPLLRGTHYAWRVNVRTSGGWIASTSASFDTPACAR